MAASPPAQTDQHDTWEVLPEEVSGLRIQFDDLLILDCRTEHEYRTLHVRGAKLLPLQEMSIRVPELENWRHRVVLIYCRSGRRSRIVARYLSERGFRCVRSVAGGIESWEQRDPGACEC
ncbi:MAG: rhodanese-like domain-containing protein [Planctomycetes bacterium]|nr:rhodanese-like domain-containing protein [Planctomycetota bacterium]